MGALKSPPKDIAMTPDELQCEKLSALKKETKKGKYSSNKDSKKINHAFHLNAKNTGTINKANSLLATANASNTGSAVCCHANDASPLFLSLSLVAMLVPLLFSTSAFAEKYFSIKDGQLERPTGFREWVYVGTPVTPNDMNNGKAAFPEFHNIYIDPKSWKHWNKTGSFREGTILIKELVSVGSKAAVSGTGYFQGKFIGLEATIKSAKHFPNEPGNWAYFSFSTKDHKTLTSTAKAFPAAACNACHDGATADDFVFTQYYPVLSAGKGAGKAATGGVKSSLGMGH